jgi:ribonuclease P protein subunit RPR2
MDIRRKKVIKSTVRSSIEKLLGEARKSYEAGRKDRSARYVTMARDLLKKNKIKLPKEVKNSFCRKCGVVWIPGKTVTVYYDRKISCLRVRCQCGYSKRL